MKKPKTSLSRLLTAAASFAAATAVVTSLASPATAQVGSSLPGMPGMAPGACAANTVINVPGGTNTVAFVPQNFPMGPYTMQVGTMMRAQGDTVDRYVPYNSFPGGTHTYIQAVNDGYNKARGMIASEAARCPNTKFSLFGYSMGADIASKITSDIANGRGPVGTDRFASTALMANPHRDASKGAVQAGGAHSKSGAFEAYPGGYGKVANRVLELCRAGDITCDTPATATPLAKAFAKTALLQGIVPMHDLKANIDSLSPAEQQQFYNSMPSVFNGINIHTNYTAVNGVGQSVDFLARHLHRPGSVQANSRSTQLANAADAEARNLQGVGEQIRSAVQPR